MVHDNTEQKASETKISPASVGHLDEVPREILIWDPRQESKPRVTLEKLEAQTSKCMLKSKTQLDVGSRRARLASRPVVPFHQRTESRPGAFSIQHGSESPPNTETPPSLPPLPRERSIVATVVDDCSVYAEKVIEDRKKQKYRPVIFILISLVVALFVLVAILIPRAKETSTGKNPTEVPVTLNHSLGATLAGQSYEPTPPPTLRGTPVALLNGEELWINESNKTTSSPTVRPILTQSPQSSSAASPTSSPPTSPIVSITVAPTIFSTAKPFSFLLLTSKPSYAPKEVGIAPTGITILPQAPTRTTVSNNIPESTDSSPGTVGLLQIQGIAWDMVGEGLQAHAARIKWGKSISLNGDGSIITVGAPFDGPNMEGSVHNFQKRGRRWRLLGEPINGQYIGGLFGSSVSTSRDGLTFVAGAPEAMNFVGLAQVFSYNGLFWEEKGRPLVGREEFGMNGDKVAISSDGTTVAVAASKALGNPDDSASLGAGRVQVYAYRKRRGMWVQKGQDLIGEKAFDGFGTGVALNRKGQRLVVGAPNGGRKSEGEVSVFEFHVVENEWYRVGGKIRGDDRRTKLGNSVAISLDGDRLIAGAHQYGNGRGLARVFDFNGISWTQMGQDLVGASEGDQLGWTVSMNGVGSAVAVGTNKQTNGGALVFRHKVSKNLWERVSQALGREPGMYSVAISTDTGRVAVAGVPSDSSDLSSSLVRIFEERGQH